MNSKKGKYNFFTKNIAHVVRPPCSLYTFLHCNMNNAQVCMNVSGIIHAHIWNLGKHDADYLPARDFK